MAMVCDQKRGIGGERIDSKMAHSVSGCCCKVGISENSNPDFTVFASACYRFVRFNIAAMEWANYNYLLSMGTPICRNENLISK